MLISDYDFDLPEELIAQHPLDERDASRMLVVDRVARELHDEQFARLPDLLDRRDVLVLNNTKVFPARLPGKTETGAKVEVFLIREVSKRQWETLVKPLRRLREGKLIIFGDNLLGHTVEVTPEGRAIIEFDFTGDFFEHLNAVGRTPIPPYIKRGEDVPIDEDRERYQTVFAATTGAIAAPTAGLHFTSDVLTLIREKGVEIVEVTLHVGYGTFEPVRVDDLSQHKVMPELYEINQAAADSLNRAKTDDKRLIAVGTTTTRTLENSIARHGEFRAEKAYAELTITPCFEFKAVGGMLTNFHLPKSSLLVLVSTFAGHELIMNAYKHAVRQRYRFYSYGDCMLIL